MNTATQKVLPPISFCDLTTDHIASIAVAVGVPMLLGYLAGSHVRKFKELYYRDVAKPRFLPPSWSFGPIWAILYAAMGYSSYLVYRMGEVHGVSVFRALTYYTIQLAFNLCWPALFFRYRNHKVSLYIITANLLTAAITAYKFYQINEESGLLLLPYLTWLTGSGYINKLIWRMNQSNPLLLKDKLFTYPSEMVILKARADNANNALALATAKSFKKVE